ncbi:MAG TPA: hypothetical protein DCW43_02475, partial [Clostridiales bacterium]|nr:hypothetical protein [Clostridiales bacterium]
FFSVRDARGAGTAQARLAKEWRTAHEGTVRRGHGARCSAGDGLMYGERARRAKKPQPPAQET